MVQCNYMRTITIRQLQQHLFNELQSLPVTITRNGKPSFIVTTFDNVTTYKDVTTSPHVTTSPVAVQRTVEPAPDRIKIIQSARAIQTCKHGAMIGLCKLGCEK
jgi:antitoxin (DNA-binding transcriptional repressor) of toxin-antitoxin stability system